MNIPIRILIGNTPEPTTTETWGDIIDNWESYAIVWNESSNLGVDPNQAPVLDMFGDEGISIKSVVKDMSDPKKLFTDYSRSFTVPASKKNNRIFKHYYNIDITNGLDSRELIPAKIIMNNTTYKIGNLRVENSRMQNGVATHYKVTFIGKLSELARQMGVDRLNSLDFSALDNTSFVFSDEIANTTKRAVMFPISSRRDRYVVDTSTASLGIENTTNIAYVNATPEDDYGIKERDVVGTLSVGTILDAIETKYGFTFTGAFTADYIRDLYLWLHQTDKTRSGELLEAQTTSLTGSAPSWTINNANLVFNGTGGVPFTPTHIRYFIKAKGTWLGDCSIQLLRNGNVSASQDVSGDYTISVPVDPSSIGDVWSVRAQSDVSSAVSVEIVLISQEYEREDGSGTPDGYYDVADYTITGTANIGTAGTFLISNNLPKMNVMEFLSSIFKMYNIIAEVDGELNVSTKHFDHFMSEGTLKDVTKYIDVSSYEVSRPNIYSSLQMEFAEPKVALELGFLAVNGKQYGELSYTLAGSNGVRLSGSEYKLKLNNQRVPIEPLNNLANNTFTGIAYTQFSDLKGAEQGINPMFTYLTKETSGTSIAFYGNLTMLNSTSYVMPSNTHNTNQGDATYFNQHLGLYFGQELNEYDVNNTFIGIGLWNNFYRGTTAMMFDEDKRRVNFNAMLPQNIIVDLKLSDTLHISNDFYNINSIETNYLTGMSKLNLTLVGRSRLREFDPTSVKVTNLDATSGLYITYIDSITGELTKGFVVASSNATFAMVGRLCGFSHSNYTQEEV